MKKIITTIILSLVFLFATTISVTAEDKKVNRHHNNGRQNNNSYHQDDRYDNYNNNYNNYNNRPRSHYDEGKRYDYGGHYKSWDEWQRFRSQNPHVNRNGKYFHDAGGHLMFGFTDEGGNAFFFSIGR